MKVGFIGLGRMGRGMASNILGGGHELVVYNRTEGKASDLADSGACVARSVADACEGREVVVTMLADDVALEEVTLGAGGVRDSLSEGAIHLAMGTHSVRLIEALDDAHPKANQTLVAAPVLGRPDLAATGQLGILAAGPAQAVGRCGPLFEVMGRRTFEAGTTPKAATVIKLTNNFVLGCAIEAMAEAFSLVRKYGVMPGASLRCPDRRFVFGASL